MSSENVSPVETEALSESRSNGNGKTLFPAASVCVVGLGYIGLPTASILASQGYQVAGVDVREDVVETINRGEIHIEEPDLDVLVKAVVANNRLKAIREPQPADIFIICVPTPFTTDHRPDLSYVEKASRAIQPHVKPGNLIILESTSPPQTTLDVVAKYVVPAGLKVGEDVFIAHCPERVLPGRILIEAVENDRVVGGLTPNCTEKARDFYQTFVTGEVLTTTAVSAELTKLVENSFRDVNIAFANELSVLCDKFDVDVWEIIELANRHPRVNILSPGPGVGGHCISVDPWFLVDAAPELTPLIRTAREVNEGKPQHIVKKVLELSSRFTHPVIGCLGLTYKADVDDLRESPSLDITRELFQSGVGEVLVCDPLISADQFDEFPLHGLDEVLRRCTLVVLLTDHRQFREISPTVLHEKVVIDTRGIWR